MKINVIGASGCGTSTLSAELASMFQWTFLDADDYYWVVTDPPFRLKVSASERQVRLKSDFDSHQNVVLAGSMSGSWGSGWRDAFQLSRCGTVEVSWAHAGEDIVLSWDGGTMKLTRHKYCFPPVELCLAVNQRLSSNEKRRLVCCRDAKSEAVVFVDEDERGRLKRSDIAVF